MSNHQAVGLRFAEILLEYIGPRDLTEVCLRNRRSNDPQVCASHDFCDANMAMLAAMSEITGLGEDEITDGFCDEDAGKLSAEELRAPMRLWNRAWDHAKKTAFWQVLKGSQ